MTALRCVQAGSQAFLGAVLLGKCKLLAWLQVCLEFEASIRPSTLIPCLGCQHIGSVHLKPGDAFGQLQAPGSAVHARAQQHHLLVHRDRYR